MSFGENLQYLRAESNITQEELAERLEVSRQSVSKWESNSSFPEMDKLLTLCDMFRCDLDTLLRGSVQASRQADTAGYDEHMNRFSKMITAGVVLCICGFSAAALLDEVQGGYLSGPAFLLFLLAAVVLFIIGGIQHNDFCTHHDRIEPFYDAKTLEHWRQRFPVFIAVGAALCIGGVIVMGLMDGRYPEETAVAGESIAASLGLLLVAAGVGSIVYGGIQNSKYHIEEYNKERIMEKTPQHKRLSAIQSVIMLSATAIFLVWLFVIRMQKWPSRGIGFGAAAIFSVGGILCAIASTLLNKDDPSDGKPKD